MVCTAQHLKRYYDPEDLCGEEWELNDEEISALDLQEMCNGSGDSTQFIHQYDQNFNDSQMYISAVNFPLVPMFSVRRQMSPVSARRVAFVFRDFSMGFI